MPWPFSGTRSHGFHLDDHYHVAANPEIRQVGPVGRHFTDPRTMSSLDRIVQYRPLLPLSLSLSYALTGMSPCHPWQMAKSGSSAAP
jgi:hypothetical protein